MGDLPSKRSLQLFKGASHHDVVNYRTLHLAQYLRKLLAIGDVLLNNVFQTFLGIKHLITRDTEESVAEIVVDHYDEEEDDPRLEWARDSEDEEEEE